MERGTSALSYLLIDLMALGQFIAPTIDPLDFPVPPHTMEQLVKVVSFHLGAAVFIRSFPVGKHTVTVVTQWRAVWAVDRRRPPRPLKQLGRVGCGSSEPTPLKLP